MKILKYFYLFLTALPLITLLSFYSLVARGFILLGRLPVPNLDDPSLLLGWHYYIVATLLGICLLPSIVPWIGLSIYGWRSQQWSKKCMVVCTVLYPLSLVATFLILRADLGHFTTWFAD